MNEVSRCLEGVRVVDLSQFEAGPSCTEVLAWLGADVVKVETPRGGDPGRSTGAKPGQDGLWFALLNANKRSMTVNLKSEAGIDLIKRMISNANVFIENFAPGTIERLGLGYEVLRQINPKIIYAQIKGFGTGSPYESFLAFDSIGQATGGSMSITGERGAPPVRPGPTVADSGSGMLMAASIMGALYRQQATGVGARLELAMQDAVMQYLRTAFSEHGNTGRAAQRAGAKSPSVVNVPSNIYPCSPGGSSDYIYVYASRKAPDQWHRLLKAMGKADLIGDPLYETAQARVKNESLVDSLISDWTRQRDKYEAMRILGEAGVPVGALFDTMELENDESFQKRGIIQTIEHPTLGALKVLAWPVRFDGRPPAVQAAPTLGQHTEEVLRQWLNMSQSDIEKMKRDGVM